MNQLRLKAFLRTACLAWFGLWAIASAAHAQAFPQAGKPLRIIVPFPAGGQTDIQARALAPKLQAQLGVPVLVDNKPGASTFIGTQDLIRSAPDGHTILYTIGVTVMRNPHLYSKLPYDAFKDLAPLMFAARSGRC